MLVVLSDVFIAEVLRAGIWYPAWVSGCQPPPSLTRVDGQDVFGTFDRRTG
jgi:hypothetical protein